MGKLTSPHSRLPGYLASAEAVGELAVLMPAHPTAPDASTIAFMSRTSSRVKALALLVGIPYLAGLFAGLGYVFDRFNLPREMFIPASMILWLVPLFLLHLVDRRRRRPRHPAGHCPTCGYNLTGNTTGRCPECGTSLVMPVICENCERTVWICSSLQGSIQPCPHCGFCSEVPKLPWPPSS